MSTPAREVSVKARALASLVALSACRIAQPLGARADASADTPHDASDDRREELTWRYGVVAAGGLRSCATVAGYVFCWGSPWGGALGQTRETPSPAPLFVPRVETVDDLVMGDRFTCARSLGEVWCWGENDETQLGAPGDTRATPDRVPGLSDVRALTASSKTVCARRGDGAWWCWGEQMMGAAREVEAFRGATSVALGQVHRCGVWPEGRLRCVGANNAGQLGDGTAVDRTEMVDAVGDDGRPIGGVVEARASAMNTCALMGARREVRCWGALTPLPVVTLGADEALRTIGVGERHVCAITEAGRALCWGRNEEGQLGDGTTASSSEARLRPVVMPEGVRLGALAVGFRHACAMELSAEALWCWGFNASGQLGGGDLEPHRTPVRVALPDR